MKNYWLDRRKERVQPKKEGKYVYPKSFWATVQKTLNKRKATGP